MSSSALLVSSSLAAAAAGLGALPLLIWRRPPSPLLGWANAVAAGFMLGAAYLLMAAGLPHLPAWGAFGSALGIGYSYLAHATSGTADLEVGIAAEPNPRYASRALLLHALHAAPEGLAIGAAAVVGPGFGVQAYERARKPAVALLVSATLVAMVLFQRSL